MMTWFIKTPKKNNNRTLNDHNVSDTNINQFFLENLESREYFEPLQSVKPGKYLELTKDHQPTERVIVVNDKSLPEALQESNTFIMLTDQEVIKLRKLWIYLIMISIYLRMNNNMRNV